MTDRDEGLAAEEGRSVVFITHGNPEDNDFTSWLGGRLTAAGCDLWTDLTRLIGGEVMWRDIDEAIRKYAKKQIVVLSKAAREKEGVITEIEIGKAVAKQLRDDRFVIPVRIDNLPVMPQMMGRKIIDFSKNWADGLSRIPRHSNAIMSIARHNQMRKPRADGSPSEPTRLPR